MRVVLPAPLRPTSPILSPGATRKLTSCINSLAPARTSRCWAVIIRLASVWAGPARVPSTGRSRVHRQPTGERQCASTRRPGSTPRGFATSVRRRGGGGGMGGGGMRIPIPGGTKAGGGIGGILIIVLFIVLTQCVGGGTGGPSLPDTGLDASRMSGTDTGRYANCKTGADAEKSTDCARVAVENSLTDYWADALPAQSNATFRPIAAMQTFTGGTSTGCGDATAEVGPFYCPADDTIYLDTTFFEQVLQQQLNGPAGEFVEPYVLAHEYGHHIQNVLGTMGQVQTQRGPNSDAVRLELQADCYAGMWAKNATSTDDAGGEALILDLTQEDIQQAIEAAKSVGDDRIQQQTTGQGQQGAVDPRLGGGADEVVPGRLHRGQPRGLRHLRTRDGRVRAGSRRADVHRLHRRAHCRLRGRAAAGPRQVRPARRLAGRHAGCRRHLQHRRHGPGGAARLLDHRNVRELPDRPHRDGDRSRRGTAAVLHGPVLRPAVRRPAPWRRALLRPGRRQRRLPGHGPRPGGPRSCSTGSTAPARTCVPRRPSWTPSRSRRSPTGWRSTRPGRRHAAAGSPRPSPSCQVSCGPCWC